MNKDVTVVVARKSDNYEVARLFKQLYSGKGEDEAPYYPYFDDVDPTHVKFDHKLFIAKAGDKTVGFCWSMYYEHVKKKCITIIEEMIVDEKYRGKG